MRPQHWWAVYDTEANSDFYGFDTQAEAEAEMNRWLESGMVESLKGDEWCASWGRLYVCSADRDTVPNNGDISDWACEWSLWDYDHIEGGAVTNYRKLYSSWGVSDFHDKYIVEKEGGE